MTWIDTALEEARKQECDCVALVSPDGVEVHDDGCWTNNPMPALLEAVKKVCEKRPFYYHRDGIKRCTMCGKYDAASPFHEHHEDDCPWILLRKAAGYEALEGEA